MTYIFLCVFLKFIIIFRFLWKMVYSFYSVIESVTKIFGKSMFNFLLIEKFTTIWFELYSDIPCAPKKYDLHFLGFQSLRDYFRTTLVLLWNYSLKLNWFSGLQMCICSF